MDSNKNTPPENQLRKRVIQIILFLFFSIIIHTAFVCIFFQYSFHKRALSWIAALTKQLTPEEKKQFTQYIKTRKAQRQAQLQKLQKIKHPELAKLSNLPAKLRAPKSDFGWVMFDEPPQTKQKRLEPTQIPTTMDGDIGQANHPVATEGNNITKASMTAQQKQQPLTIQSSIAEKKELTEAPPQQEQIETPKPTSKQAQHKKSRFDELSSPKDTQPQVEGKGELVVEHAKPQSIEERIANIKALQEKISAYEGGTTPPMKTTPQKSITTQKEERLIGGEGGIRVRGAKSIDKKEKRNIIALTKGFIEKHWGEEGSDLIDRDGDPNKRPSFEELKYISYESKVSWCLQSSWKQNFGYRPMARPLEGDVVVEFTLDEHGNLVTCNILQSSGFAELDAMVMKNMKVASPFPPLPKHFGTTKYTTGRIIQVRADRYGF
jgi:TonB family protein